jgi:hypothetical protein
MPLFLKEMFRRMKSSSDGVYLSLLFILALVLCHHLLQGKLLGSGVDFESSFVRVVGLIQCWKEGLFLGRWLPDINAGHGYPLLNFYSPLFTYFAAGFGWILRDPVAGMNTAIILAFFFSAAAMYLFSREFWGKDGAFLSAVAYMYCPYHIWDVFFRGACAEFFSSIFFPLVAWSLYRVYKKLDAGSILMAMISLAGLILSHNLMAAVFLLVASVYVCFLFFLIPSDKRGLFFLSCIVVLVGALCLTAYFWIPILYEKDFVSLWRSLGIDHRQELFNLQQLFGHAWKVYPYKRPMVSFQLGLVHIFLGAVSLVFWIKIRAYDQKAAGHIVFWLVIGSVFGYLMLIDSLWFWDVMPGLKYFDFPWRFFLILNLVLCFIVGALAVVFSGRFLRPLIFGVTLILVAVNIGFCKPDADMKTFQSIDWKNWIYSQNPRDGMEYLPRWVKRISVVSPEKRFEIVQGQGDIFVKDLQSGPRSELTVRTTTGALVAYHHFYFPGWAVFVDGKETKINFENDFGLILFMVPPGEHQVVVRFGHTSVRVVGEVISLLMIFLFILGVIFRKKIDVGLCKRKVVAISLK